MPLSKRQVVLTRVMTGDIATAFRDEAGATTCAFPSDTWQDMGSPEQVTVTVEPGNTIAVEQKEKGE